MFEKSMSMMKKVFAVWAGLVLLVLFDERSVSDRSYYCKVNKGSEPWLYVPTPAHSTLIPQICLGFGLVGTGLGLGVS